MKNKISWRRIWPRALTLALDAAVCLILPNADNFNTGHYWLYDLLGRGGQLVHPIWVGLRTFLAEPLFWGLLVFFLLGCADLWLIQRDVRPGIGKKPRLAMRGAAVLLAAALIYWTAGFILMVVFPPMSFGMGVYLMNHRILLGVCWCLCAVLWQLSLLKAETPAPQ